MDINKYINYLNTIQCNKKNMMAPKIKIIFSPSLANNIEITGKYKI